VVIISAEFVLITRPFGILSIAIVVGMVEEADRIHGFDYDVSNGTVHAKLHS
jgi:hypothetical protein